jgi:hypothetical protein
MMSFKKLMIPHSTIPSVHAFILLSFYHSFPTSCWFDCLTLCLWMRVFSASSTFPLNESNIISFYSCHIMPNIIFHSFKLFLFTSTTQSTSPHCVFGFSYSNHTNDAVIHAPNMKIGTKKRSIVKNGIQGMTK